MTLSVFLLTLLAVALIGVGAWLALGAGATLALDAAPARQCAVAFVVGLAAFVTGTMICVALLV